MDINQDMTQAIMQAAKEAAKAEVQAIVVARAEAGIEPSSMTGSVGPKTGRPALRLTTFDSRAAEKCKKT